MHEKPLEEEKPNWLPGFSGSTTAGNHNNDENEQIQLVPFSQERVFQRNFAWWRRRKIGPSYKMLNHAKIYRLCAKNKESACVEPFFLCFLENF